MGRWLDRPAAGLHLLPLQEVIWASVFGRRYLGSVRSTAMPFTFGMSALGPILVAYYYDIAGNYDLSLVVIASCNLASAFMLYRLNEADTTKDVVNPSDAPR